MAGETATACNARGDLSWTHVVLNCLYDYFSCRYNESHEDDMDQYVFGRAHQSYYGVEQTELSKHVLANWDPSKPLPFFVTRVYDLLVEEGKLPRIEVRTLADAMCERLVEVTT